MSSPIRELLCTCTEFTVCATCQAITEQNTGMLQAELECLRSERDSLGKEADRLRRDYAREKQRGDALELAMQNTARDAMEHRFCHMRQNSALSRAERAEKILSADYMEALMEGALEAFNKVAGWNVLSKPQMRRYLAEHLAKAVADRAKVETHICDNCLGIDPMSCMFRPRGEA